MLIDNTNDKVASEEEKAIWKILDDYKLNPMLQPNCADEIIELVNKLFIQRVSGSLLKDEQWRIWKELCKGETEGAFASTLELEVDDIYDMIFKGKEIKV